MCNPCSSYHSVATATAQEREAIVHDCNLKGPFRFSFSLSFFFLWLIYPFSFSLSCVFMASSVTASSSSSSHTTLSQLSQILSFNVMYWPTLPELFDPIEEFDGDPARLYVPPPPPIPYSDDEDDSEDDDRLSSWSCIDKSSTKRGQKRATNSSNTHNSWQKKIQHGNRNKRYRQSSTVTPPYHNVRKSRKQHDQQQHKARFACHKCGMVFDRLFDHRRHVTAVHARYNKQVAHPAS